MRIVGTKEIELKLIKPLFPRDVDEGELEELARSVEAVGGVVHPVVVRPSKEEGFYDLICGYRRCLALRKIGLAVVEAVVVECDDKEAFQLSLIENLQRVNLSDYEVAKRLKELRDKFNLTPTQIAQLLGKSKGWVEDHLRMLELEKEVAEAVSRPTVGRPTVGQVMDKITAYHAQVILKQPEPIRRRLVEEVVEKIIEGEEPPSARTLERRAKKLFKPKEEEATAEAVQAPRPSPPSAEVELKAEKPEEEPRVIYSRVVRGAEDIHKAFDELKQVLERGVAPTAPMAVEAVEAGAPIRPSVPVERPIEKAEVPKPAVEEAVSAINDLLLQLNDVLERLRLSATSLVGRRIRAVFEHPYEEGEEEEAVGALIRADRRAVYVEMVLGGGAKAERMVRWYDLKKVELA